MENTEVTAFFITPLSKLTKKWRIFYEESVDLNPRSERTDFEELRGDGDSRIYRHGQEVLAVSTDYSRRQAMLSRIPGLIPSSGSVFLFLDTLLDTVADAIHAKRKKQFTPEQRQNMVQRMQRINAQRKMATTKDEEINPTSNASS